MEKKYFSRYKETLAPLQNLVEVQLNSFNWLVKEGLQELFKEFSPIDDYSAKEFSLEFLGFALDEPKFDEYYAKAHLLSYEAPLRIRCRLTNKKTGELKEQEIYLTDFPMMTPRGTFKSPRNRNSLGIVENRSSTDSTPIASSISPRCSSVTCVYLMEF